MYVHLCIGQVHCGLCVCAKLIISQEILSPGTETDFPQTMLFDIGLSSRDSLTPCSNHAAVFIPPSSQV